MKVVYLTSGAAGMYCGSCMHDNALARALTRVEDLDVILAPTYTPIRTDEEDISIDRVFFGGISVFLQQKIPLFRLLPSFLDRLIDQPWLIRMATAKAAETDPRDLGALTVSMLKGKHGRQRKEVIKLCRWLRDEAKPDVVLLSNMLIAGCAPTIHEELGARVVVTLQGDDIFLRDLPEPFRQQAIDELGRLAPSVDRFIAHSGYYADFMSDYLSLPRERIDVTPLCIDVDGFAELEHGAKADAPVIGYLARLAPEKGLHNLVDAFIQIHQLGKFDCRLKIAGWLGKHNEAYAEEQFQRLRDAGLGERFEYVGSVDRPGKLEFLDQVDVLSVPTDYHEPKGLFVLEALAAAVPVVQPAHGAFPELLEQTGGGLLVPPGDNAALAEALTSLLKTEPRRQELAARGRESVLREHNSATMAERTVRILRGDETTDTPAAP